MKKAILCFAALSLTIQTSFADVRFGGKVIHKFSCQSVTDRAGVGYSLEVATQPLAPQHNTRGITLIRRVVYPGSQPKKIELIEIEQDAFVAKFALKNVEVILDKRTFTASIFVEDELSFICRKK